MISAVLKNRRAWFYGYALCFWGCSLITLFSCGENSSPENARKGEQLFFDLRGYFDKEAQRLKGRTVKKAASIDGRREEQIQDSLDFARELKIFSENDINRPAWSDSYQIDSTFNGQGELVQISYTANSEKLKTRKIQIDFADQAVSKIYIESGTSSAVADTKQKLVYDPSGGYSIERFQQVALTDGNTFLVEVEFREN